MNDDVVVDGLERAGACSLEKSSAWLNFDAFAAKHTDYTLGQTD
jgi:hypothetical protein